MRQGFLRDPERAPLLNDYSAELLAQEHTLIVIARRPTPAVSPGAAPCVSLAGPCFLRRPVWSIHSGKHAASGYAMGNRLWHDRLSTARRGHRPEVGPAPVGGKRQE